MISIKVFAKQVEKFTLDNSPSILTGVGAVGAVATAYLTGKASFKAADILASEAARIDLHNVRLLNDDPKPEGLLFLDKKDKAKLVWKEYIPAVGTGVITVASIICANRISTRRAAAMAAAYSLSEKAYSEYKEKVVEKFNANKERQVRDEIAQDRITKNPPQENQIIITGNGDVLCYDLSTGRYFHSSMEKLRSVMNDINQQVNTLGYAALSDLYVALGLTTTPYSEELGWTVDKLLDLQFSAVLTDDNQPCISIDYMYEPIRGYLSGPS